MRLPEFLQEASDRIVERASPTLLRKATDFLSAEYRQTHSSDSIFPNEARRLAYLAARFPATFSAVSRVLREIQTIQCKKILDLGAGPGTATWAALGLLAGIEASVLIEKSPDAISLGKALVKDSPFEGRGEWICKDLESIEAFPSADLAILSYALGELNRPEIVIERLWKSPISLFVIVEPGTPFGYRNILMARERFLRLGGSLLAPCPHSKACPLKKDDWCHFSVRLERTRLHRLLKGASLGYEDEKFSYLIISRTPSGMSSSRILRHPLKGSGHVRLSLCTKEGERVETVATRKSKESYRLARDAEWGDSWV